MHFPGSTRNEATVGVLVGSVGGIFKILYLIILYLYSDSITKFTLKFTRPKLRLPDSCAVLVGQTGLKPAILIGW